ncbi:hypothetical protein AB9E06_36955 [Rhizobium leguminosarum]|uniref:hypothetical protein n=1 Tax=Rhizobium leguminosarum TaxID=384 RepID=UPI003F96B04C
MKTAGPKSTERHEGGVINDATPFEEGTKSNASYLDLNRHDGLGGLRYKAVIECLETCPNG